jgi:hypothetical protein
LEVIEVSSDYANVQNVVPGTTITAYIGMGFGGHTKEVAEATRSKEGHEALIAACKVLAMTAIDLFTDPELLEKIKKEFAEIEKFPYPQPTEKVEIFPPK